MGWMCVNERGHIRRTCQRRARQKKKIAIRELECERFSSRVQCRIYKMYSGGTNREEERQRQRKNKNQELTSSSPSPSSVTISKVPSSYTSVASSFELTKPPFTSPAMILTVPSLERLLMQATSHVLFVGIRQ